MTLTTSETLALVQTVTDGDVGGLRHYIESLHQRGYCVHQGYGGAWIGLCAAKFFASDSDPDSVLVGLTAHPVPYREIRDKFMAIDSSLRLGERRQQKQTEAPRTIDERWQSQRRALVDALSTALQGDVPQDRDLADTTLRDAAERLARLNRRLNS